MDPLAQYDRKNVPSLSVNVPSRGLKSMGLSTVAYNNMPPKLESTPALFSIRHLIFNGSDRFPFFQNLKHPDRIEVIAALECDADGEALGAGFIRQRVSD
jgi:hypothetical protein